MRPIIEKRKFEVRHLVYFFIVILSVASIAVVLYLQFYKEEKMGVIIGITNEKEDTEYKNLKENFFNIFDNNLNVIDEYSGDVNKIINDGDLIILAQDIQEQKEKYTLDIKIPYFNINSEICKKINMEIKSTFKDKANSIISSNKDIDVLYNVRYKAYVENDNLSLIILSELKEGNNSERIIVQTYNYNLKENKQVDITEILQKKSIDENQANATIRDEINKSQEHNLKLAELGYNINVRDANSDFYKIKNVEQFFVGDNGYLYVVYPYGNTEFTNEMDVIIFR